MHGRQAVEVPAFQRRLDRQAAATRHLRAPLYEQAGLPDAARILDVGAGSGAVSQELAQWGGNVVAIDVEMDMVQRSRQAGLQALHADGARLPFADGHFDVAACNLMLLWARDPAAVVQEMARVVRPGGVVLASMEPDYSGKIHWPRNPLVDVVFQGQAVARRGGDPEAGRKLRQWFVGAGLQTSVGISNTQIPTTAEDLANFRRHRNYYRRLLRENGFERRDIHAWEEEYLQAMEAGIELCFLPLFHAIGRKADVARP